LRWRGNGYGGFRLDEHCGSKDRNEQVAGRVGDLDQNSGKTEQNEANEQQKIQVAQQTGKGTNIDLKA